jgi:hypothetical protein
MKSGKTVGGVIWYVGTIQYGACLFVGGALWFLAARLTDFFGGNLPAQAVAGLLLLALIGLEAWWAHIPQVGNPVGDWIADILGSAAIAGFGMAVVLAVLLTIRR